MFFGDFCKLPPDYAASHPSSHRCENLRRRLYLCVPTELVGAERVVLRPGGAGSQGNPQMSLFHFNGRTFMPKVMWYSLTESRLFYFSGSCAGMMTACQTSDVDSIPRYFTRDCWHFRVCLDFPCDCSILIPHRPLRCAISLTTQHRITSSETNRKT
jgi:hypothetical protein